MSPALILTLIQSLPTLIALLNTMIKDFTSGNSSFTEAEFLQIQSEVMNTITSVNDALNLSIKAKLAADAGVVATPPVA